MNLFGRATSVHDIAVKQHRLPDLRRTRKMALQRGSALFRLDVRRPDHLAPLFCLVVHLRMLAKSTSAAAPRRTHHPCAAMTALFGGSGDDLLREVIQIDLQLLDISEFFEVSPI